MDRVIVTGLLIIAGVITAVILLGVLNTSVEETAGTIKTTGKQADAQTKSGITILQVLPNGNGTLIDIWVKNTGSIQIQPLENVDVFLMDIEGRVAIQLSKRTSVSFSDAYLKDEGCIKVRLGSFQV